MKKTLLLIALFSLLISPVFGQFYFSASPGINLNGASFGYKIGKVVPYAGLQMMHANFKMDLTNYDWSGSQWDKNTYALDVTANIIIPTIGAKYFFIEQNKLKAYGNLSLYKPIIKVKASAEEDGVAVPDFDKEIKNQVDNIKLFGGSIGFGVEYFFDDNFSLGGEFGIRYMKNKYTMEGNPETGSSASDTRMDLSEFNLNIMPTYTKVSLNFYFGGGKEVSAN
jgi:hypothetical protein